MAEIGDNDDVSRRRAFGYYSVDLSLDVGQQRLLIYEIDFEQLAHVRRIDKTLLQGRRRCLAPYCVQLDVGPQVLADQILIAVNAAQTSDDFHVLAECSYVIGCCKDATGKQFTILEAGRDQALFGRFADR